MQDENKGQSWYSLGIIWLVHDLYSQFISR